jgi:hypothetical protein
MKSPVPSSQNFGVIVLAAYQPDYALFARQLKSIQNQTHRDFICQITADGGFEEIRDRVAEIVEGDDRFQVIGFDHRLGFYQNFERGLAAVPSSARWVALSDQDDFWYEDKLQMMLPHLEREILVSAQARVVHDSGNVIQEATDRRNSPFLQLFVQNQVTGGIAVFRRSLLDVALPFPRLDTMTQVHDHWLAICAQCMGGVKILDTVVQDYVQHGGNVIGEAVKGFNPVRSVRRAKQLANRYEGGDRWTDVARLVQKMTYGWRRIMAETLIERFGDTNTTARLASTVFGAKHRWFPILRVLTAGVRNGTVSIPFLLTFIAGVPFEVYERRSSAHVAVVNSRTEGL